MSKLLLYCTKAKPYLVGNKNIVNSDIKFWLSKDILNKEFHINGKIVAECDFEVEKIQAIYINEYVYDLYHSFYRIQDDKEWLDKTCLNMKQLDNYLKGKNGYAIHIKNLHIFDKPRELSECHKKYEGINYSPTCYMPIATAPQNMMRVWLYENGEWVMYILISIQSQWLCKILNREKTIEIRKKVLKEMLK